MYKTSVYTLVIGNIYGLTHQKQQKLQKVILPSSHWLCGNVLLTNIAPKPFCRFRVLTHIALA